MLIVPKKILDDIFEHSRESYPEECCGILVGREDGSSRIVSESHRAKNVSKERRRERYLIDENKLIEVLRSTRGLPVDVVGFYHSHPDSPSRPSSRDIEMAGWPGYSYLIVSSAKDRIVSAQSWVMGDESDSFDEEPMRIEDEPGPAARGNVVSNHQAG